MIELTYNIPKDYKVSTNKIYAGIHWTKRKKTADFYHNLTQEDCNLLNPIEDKVNLSFKFYWKTRYLDSSNCSYIAKCLEDSLVKNGLIKDDTNKYIGEFSLESILLDTKERKRLENDYVDIIIIEYKCKTEKH